MKKTLAIILSVALLFLSTGFQSFAINIHKEFDLTNYTLEDIKNMSVSEFRDLLAEFERLYDPFNTYATDTIIDTQKSNGTVSPQWTSGEKDGSETGSHEIITARACAILASDMGFFGDTQSDQLLISLTISLASLLPDKNASDRLELFSGHFYDPNTEKNFTGSTKNTAKTNAMDCFKKAINAYNANNTSDAYEQLGRSLHYLQDACQPQHASNFTEISAPAGTHGDFEDFVEAEIDTYINRINSVKTFNFFGKGNYPYIASTPNYYVKEAAKIAYSYKDYTNTSNRTNWDYVANISVQNSVAFSAILMYSFAGFIGVALK